MKSWTQFVSLYNLENLLLISQTQISWSKQPPLKVFMSEKTMKYVQQDPSFTSIYREQELWVIGIHLNIKLNQINVWCKLIQINEIAEFITCIK